MSEIKAPMTIAYKAVFTFSITMTLLALLGGSTSGIGVVLWGYTAWLIYKRRNKSLVSLFEALLWFEVIAGGAGFIFIALSMDSSTLLGLYAIFILLAIGIAYGMRRFFKSQINQEDITPSTDLLSNKFFIILILVITLLLGVYLSGFLNNTISDFKKPKEQSKSLSSKNPIDIDTMEQKFYRVTKNLDLIKSGKVTMKDLSDEELRDIVAYGDTEKNYFDLKTRTTTLDALTIQQLINLKAYYKVNKISS